MPHIVTFYAMVPERGEIVVTVHRIPPIALAVYTATPGVALEAVRSMKGEPKAHGFRVTDESGRVLFDYVDRSGRG